MVKRDEVLAVAATGHGLPATKNAVGTEKIPRKAGKKKSFSKRSHQGEGTNQKAVVGCEEGEGWLAVVNQTRRIGLVEKNRESAINGHNGCQRTEQHETQRGKGCNGPEKGEKRKGRTVASTREMNSGVLRKWGHPA